MNQIYLGIVLSKDPLRIDAAGLLLEKRELLIPSRLKKGYQRKIKLREIQTIENVTAVTAMLETEEDFLRPGDEVLLCALEGGQQFVILDKVVAL